MNRFVSTVSLLSLVSLAACGPSTEAADPSASAAITAASTTVRPGHVACTADGQPSLELLTQAGGAIEALYEDGAVVFNGTIKRGKVDVGQFLSGTYSLRLDSAVEKGEKGSVVLVDDEGPDNGGIIDTSYACVPKAPVAAKLSCTPSDASQLPATLVLTAAGALTVNYGNGALVRTVKLVGGDASFGMILGGVYTLHLDADLLDGQDGTATLYDNEGPDNGGTSATAYSCVTGS